METVYIGLGANLGDREATIQKAVALMNQTPEVRVLKLSRLRETKPLGPQDQPDFLNGVAVIETTLLPHRLLERLQAIEDQLGRTRQRRWGPRTIDLDILFYGDQSIQDSRLTVPHPEIKNRPFLQDALEELRPTHE